MQFSDEFKYWYLYRHDAIRLVTWDLGGGVPHIGIVVDRKSPQNGRYMIVHNIGQGPKMEDVLFNWKITGHYRYFGPSS